MTARIWQDRLIVGIGSFGPIGRLPASGTCTVLLLGAPLFFLLHRMSLAPYCLMLVVAIAVSIVIHDVGDRILGTKDSSQLVWDELIGFLIAVTGVQFSWQTCVVAVILERVLDILKVPPAGWIERRVPGGAGVVGDDIIAGAYTCLILHVLCRIFPALMGV